MSGEHTGVDEVVGYDFEVDPGPQGPEGLDLADMDLKPHTMPLML